MAQRCHGLLLQAADGKHTAADGDLARHGDITADRRPAERGGQRRAYGDTGGRTVLRHGTLREVDMDIARLVEVGRDVQLLSTRAQIAHGRLHGLLHHIAEVSGQDELAAAVHDIALDLESLTADGSPGKAGHKTDRIGLRQLIRQDAARAEEALQIRARHGHAARGLV